jgi:hypothetical protein
MAGRCFALAAMVMALGGCAWAQAGPTCAVVPRSLEAMRNCYRPLLVFSPSGDDARLKQQVKLLDAAADDMMDRFVLFTPIVPDGRQVTTPIDAQYTVLSSDETKGVRAKFHIPAGEFDVLLLDEDGSLLLRSRSAVDADRLNAVIDRTPRRQQEMHRPHAN